MALGTALAETLAALSACKVDALVIARVFGSEGEDAKCGMFHWVRLLTSSHDECGLGVDVCMFG